MSCTGGREGKGRGVVVVVWRDAVVGGCVTWEGLEDSAEFFVAGLFLACVGVLHVGARRKPGGLEEKERKEKKKEHKTRHWGKSKKKHVRKGSACSLTCVYLCCGTIN